MSPTSTTTTTTTTARATIPTASTQQNTILSVDEQRYELYTIVLNDLEGKLGLLLTADKESSKNGYCSQSSDSGGRPSTRSVVSRKRRRTERKIYIRYDSPALVRANNISKLLQESDGNRSRPWSNLDELVEFTDYDLCFNGLSGPYSATFNKQMLKFILVGGVSPADTLHCVRDRKGNVIIATDVLFDPIRTFGDLFKDATNYPISLTFQRCLPLRVPGDDVVVLQPTSPYHRQVQSNEVICLLESSDDEAEHFPRARARVSSDDETHHFTRARARAQTAVPQSCFPSKGQPLSPGTLPSCLPRASPDPEPIFHPDDFVMTPFGPAKVLSHAICRYAQTDESLLHPILMYTLDFRFGVGYIPSYEVTHIQPHNKTLLTYHGVQITLTDRLRLWPYTFLNDSIINFYTKYLQHRHQRPPQHLHHFHFFPTYFYTRIACLESGTCQKKTPQANTTPHRQKLYQELKGWTKHVDIFQKSFLVLAVNFDLHWTLALVCHPGCVDRIHRAKTTKESGEKDGEKRSVEDQECVVIDDDEEEDEDEEDEQSDNHSDESYVLDTPSSPLNCQTTQQYTPSKPNQPPPNNEEQALTPSTLINNLTLSTPTQPQSPPNPSPCILHLDSGKHLRLHKSQTIYKVIRNYLNACWEATHPSSDANMFNGMTMPGFSPQVPQQTNLKDCGVFLLEMMERLVECPPMVDEEFVRCHGGGPLDRDWFDKRVIEGKRVKIEGLIYELRRDCVD